MSKKRKTKKAYFQFFGTLGDFISCSEQDPAVEISFYLHPSVKDLMESRGVPHVEIFGLKINGKPETLDYRVNDGDRICAYPAGELAGNEHYQIKDPGNVPDVFIADVHLGKLARNLRLMGIDTWYDTGWKDHTIIEKAIVNNRTVLTRDRELLKYGDLEHGYWLRSTDPEKQVLEVLSHVDLYPGLSPFSRCLSCNGLLISVNKDEILEKIPPDVRSWAKDFYRCRNCRKIYWKGSHYEKLQAKVERIRQYLEPDDSR